MTVRNIIIINDFAYINGGAGYVAIESARALSRQDKKVILFTAVSSAADVCENNLEIVKTNQLEFINDPHRLKAVFRGIWNTHARKSFAELLNRFDTSDTIVHIHSWSKALSASVLREAIKRGYNCVITLHDYFTLCPNGGFYLYQDNTKCHLAPLSPECILKNCDSRSYYQKVWRIIRHRVQQSYGLIPDGLKNYIFVSPFSRAIMEPYLAENSKFYNLNNPITISELRGKKRGEKKYDFCVVGRISPEKGMALFARAIGELGLRGLVIGDGAMKNTLLSINPDLEITGWVDREKVFELMMQSGALVFPSLWYETQGLVVAEAAAVGVPAIVSDECAAKDMIKDNETGLLFRNNDREDLKNKMLLLNDKETIKQMGDAAYKIFWDDPPTMEQHVNKLLLIYNDILAKYRKERK